MSEKKGTPIAKEIARRGYCSRREAEKLITEGYVKVNGVVIESPLVFITDQSIKIKNVLLKPREKTKLWLFNKPRGYIVSTKDTKNFKTIYDILPSDMPRLVPVGRLDVNTEGLLLLTNDGKLANFIAHPSTAWKRVYRVKAHGFWRNINFSKYEKHGLTIDGVKYAPFEISVERDSDSTNVWLRVTIREGKNREVRNIMEYFGLTVARLIRVSFGTFNLGNLPASGLKPIADKVLKMSLGNKFIIE
jgi:23S rRNA pseudouridine2605 synthase